MVDAPSNAGCRFGAQQPIYRVRRAAMRLSRTSPPVRHARFARFAQRARTWARRSGIGGKVGPCRGPAHLERAQRSQRCVVVGEPTGVVLGFLNDQTVSTAQCHTQLQALEEPHSREAVNAMLDASVALSKLGTLIDSDLVGNGMLRFRTSQGPTSVSARHSALASESMLPALASVGTLLRGRQLKAAPALRQH
jgi:hypothetical protein